MPSSPVSSDNSDRVHAGPAYRRYLIAAGTARYDKLGESAQLPSVTSDIEAIRDLFAGRLGYDHVLPELAENPTSAQLREQIGGWLADDQRRADDIVVLYYSGHGAYGHDGRHYLLTSDSLDRNLVGTAVATEDLVRMLGGTAVQHALVVVDTCYAGAGVQDLVAMLRSVSSSRPAQEVSGSGLWFMAAARPKEEAQQHAFVPCLVRAVDNPKTGMFSQPYLDPNSVVAAVNEELGRSWPHQHARAAMGDSSGISPLLPNPRFRPDLPAGLDIEAQSHLLGREDLLSHWGPRSRGVEVEGDKGWFFTGRRQALRELVSWLAGEHDGRMRIVTGGPGSGKSALLSRLVTLSDAEYRRGLPPGQTVDPDTTPPVGCVDVAIVARDRTLSDVVQLVAGAAGLALVEPATVIAALAASGPVRFTIVVDALDEAAAPKEIARRFLTPLCAAQIAGVRLLIGTRRELLPALGSRSRVIDLDDARYLDVSDIVGYAEKVLRAGESPTSHGPYHHNVRLARQVASAVATRAYPTFLIARIVSRSLAERDTPVDIGRRDWRTNLPATVGDALDEYLERYGGDEQRVRVLLQPLSYAAGAGLPWEDLWAPIASALAGVQYHDSDIRWLLERAGAYIIEATEDGRSVYRLYHQALAEYLRDGTRGVDAHRRIARTLRTRVLREGVSTEPDWTQAHPYVRTHLAGHAARGNLLDDLIADPLFLVAASPDRLLEALPAATRDETAVSGIYQRAAHRLVPARYALNAAALELAARCEGQDAIADAFARLPLRLPWHVPWARWQPAQEYRLVGRHARAATAMTLTVFDDRQVVVSGGEEGALQCWDLVDLVPVGEPILGSRECVTAVVVGTASGQALIVSASEHGTIQRWDLADGVPVGLPLSAHDGPVTALAVAGIADRVLVVSAGADGTIRRWNLADGAAVGDPLRGHDGRVNCLAVGTVDGRCELVSGGVDWTWQRWDVDEGAPRGDPVTDHDAEVTAVAMIPIGGHAVVVSGGADTYVRLWDVVDGKRIGDPLMSHDGTVTAVAAATMGTEDMVLSAGADGTVRRWAISTAGRPATPKPAAHANGISGVATGRVGARTLLMSGGGDRLLRRWDVHTGHSVGGVVRGHDEWVNSMVAGTVHGRPVVATAGGDGTIRLWDLASGTPVGPPWSVPGWVNTVDLGTIGDVAVAVAGSNDGVIHRLNLDRGREWDEPFSSGQGSVLAVAINRVGDTDVIVSGGADGSVRCWNLRTGRPFGTPPGRHDAPVWCLATSVTDSRPVAVTGDKAGQLRWWDLAGGRPIGGPVPAHDSDVLGVATGRVGECDLVFSAGGDGRLRIWDAPGSAMYTVGTGGGLLDIAFVPPRHVVVAGWRGMFLLALEGL